MAEDFHKWLESCYFNLAPYKDSRISIVSVIGKESADNLNSSIINQLLLNQSQAFGCGSWQMGDSSPISVDAFYSTDSSVLYLHVKGVHDVETSQYLFGSGMFRDKTFFEKMAMVEMECTHLLHLIFILSHLVVFIEQGCRFDTEWLRTLKAVKSLRQKAKRRVEDALSDTVGCPKRWLEEGRLSVPTMLFAFHRSPLRADLGAAKKKELLEKLEKSLEGQLVSLLKHHRIVDNHNPESTLATLPPIPNAFAYVFRSKETLSSSEDTARDLANELFSSGAVIRDADELLAELDANVEQPRTGREKSRFGDYDFHTFVNNALNNLHSNSSKSRELVYEFPRLKNFINGAKLVYKTVIMERNFDFVSVVQNINAEVLVQERMTDSNMQKAVATYEKELLSKAAFSKQEHEEKLNLAQQLLMEKEVKGKRLNRLIQKLMKECTTIWKNGHQRCEAVSLTGHQCSLPIHEAKSIAHSTGFQLLSTCNCGRSQAPRADPFTIQSANFDFYEQSGFECCSRIEKFELPVFHPDASVASSSEEVESHLSTDEHDDGEKSVEFNPQKIKILARSRSTTARRSISPKKEQAAGKVPDQADEENLADELYTQRIMHKANSKDSVDTLSEEGSGHKRRVSQSTEESEEYESASDAEGKGELDYNESEQNEKSSQSSSNFEDEQDNEDQKKEKQLSTGLIKRSIANKEDQGRDSPAHYLDDYDSHLASTYCTTSSPAPISSLDTVGISEIYKQKKQKKQTLERIAEKFRGQYLDHMPFKSDLVSPSLLPLFPSWSIMCIGPSMLYNHSSGLRNQPNFKAGSEYLLPWDVYLTVDAAQWQKDMEMIAPASGEGRHHRGTRQRRQYEVGVDSGIAAGTTREKVKIFVGFDYECPRGHRFMIQSPTKALRHRRVSDAVLLDASELISSALPLRMPCTCRRDPRQVAQLMHIHVVTPKAPVSVILAPRIRIDGEQEGYFHLGCENEGISLTWAKYYVLRLPFGYVGREKSNVGEDTTGSLLPNCLSVVHTPISS